ncbi:uncharacterized protein JCM6883_002367 [Sporobolomyces salmoneus]|uniref:uncharacterized protein n=1 Tax=Sporobolomyces salmoneus TaxID=183962 RepID=UPI00318152A9
MVIMLTVSILNLEHALYALYAGEAGWNLTSLVEYAQASGGNKTVIYIYTALYDQWDSFSSAEQSAILEELSAVCVHIMKLRVNRRAAALNEIVATSRAFLRDATPERKPTVFIKHITFALSQHEANRARQSDHVQYSLSQLTRRKQSIYFA